MKNLHFFGGTGGLGSALCDELKGKYTIIPVGSKAFDLANYNKWPNNAKLQELLSNPEIVLIFSNYNYDAFLHKYRSAELQLELEKQISINIIGITKLLAEVLAPMRQKKYGRIILASSVLSDNPVMGASIYAATKAYYENIVKTIALENGALGITANCLQLQYMDVGLGNKLPPDFLKQKIEEIPCKRLCTIAEVAHAINFLIENEYMSGTTLKLTGGL